MAEDIVWPFTKQENKFGYENNPNHRFPATEFHEPCGRWYQGDIDPNVVPDTGDWIPTPVPEVGEYLFVLGNNTVSYYSDKACAKITRGMIESLRYYGTGSGDNQLNSPQCIAVDSTHVWIADYGNSRLMQRRKSDLSFVQKKDGVLYKCVHAGIGDVIWVGSLGKIEELNKSDLSVVRTIEYPAIGIEGTPMDIKDITTDDTYLYATDFGGNRILIYDLATLTFQSEFGYTSRNMMEARGVAYSGGFLFATDISHHKVHKVDEATLEFVSSYGHVAGGSGPGYILPMELAVDATRLFVADLNGVVQVLDHNLNHLSDISLNLVQPVGVYVDGLYIYVADAGSGYIARYNAATLAYVDHSSTLFTSIMSVCGDGTHLYVLDLGATARVVKLLKADLSYVGEYIDAILTYDPISIGVDNNYIYITSFKNIVRIDKGTLAIFDTVFMSDNDEPGQICFEGAHMYITDGKYGLISDYQLNEVSPGVFWYIPVKSSDFNNTLDLNFWMDDPQGITVDDNYLYMIDGRFAELRIYNKTTHAFVSKFITGFGRHVAVDADYMYIGCYNAFNGVRKLSKTPPYSYVGTANFLWCNSVDIAWKFQIVI